MPSSGTCLGSPGDITSDRTQQVTRGDASPLRTALRTPPFQVSFLPRDQLARGSAHSIKDMNTTAQASAPAYKAAVTSSQALSLPAEEVRVGTWILLGFALLVAWLVRA